WANPGHSTLIPYEQLSTGDEYARTMLDLGFTHAYLNVDPRMVGEDFVVAVMWDIGLGSQNVRKRPPPSDPNLRWRYLALDAIGSGRLKLVQAFPDGVEPRSILFE